MKQIIDQQTGEIKEYTDAEYENIRTAMIQAWVKAKNELDVAKEAEMLLRNKLVAFAADPTKIAGTENVELGNGYKLKVVKTQRFGFVKGADGKSIDREAIDRALTAIEETGDAGKLIADRLIKWSPELSKTEYDKLDPMFKAAIDSVLVKTPATPTVELVEPKAKK